MMSRDQFRFLSFQLSSFAPDLEKAVAFFSKEYLKDWEGDCESVERAFRRIVSHLLERFPQLLNSRNSTNWLKNQMIIDSLQGILTDSSWFQTSFDSSELDTHFETSFLGMEICEKGSAARQIVQLHSNSGIAAVYELAESTPSYRLRIEAMLEILETQPDDLAFDWIKSKINAEGATEYQKECVKAASRAFRNRAKTPNWLAQVASNQDLWVGIRATSVRELLSGWYGGEYGFSWAKSNFSDEKNMDLLISVLESVTARDSENPELFHWLKQVSENRTLQAFAWSRALNLLAFDYTGPFSEKQKWAESLAQSEGCPYSYEIGNRLLIQLNPDEDAFQWLAEAFEKESGARREQALKNLVGHWRNDQRLINLVVNWCDAPENLRKTESGFIFSALIKFWPDHPETLRLARIALEKNEYMGRRVFSWVATQIKNEQWAQDWFKEMVEEKNHGFAIFCLSKFWPDDEGIEGWLHMCLLTGQGIAPGCAATALAEIWEKRKEALERIPNLIERNPPIQAGSRLRFVQYFFKRWAENPMAVRLAIKWLSSDKFDIDRQSTIEALLPYWMKDEDFVSILKNDALRTEDFEDGCGCDNRSAAWDALDWVAKSSSSIRHWFELQLSNSEPEIRKFALASIGKLDATSSIIAKAKNLTESDPDEEVRAASIRVWATLKNGDEDANTSQLIEIVKNDGSSEVREVASRILFSHRGHETLALFLLENDSSRFVRTSALRYLDSIPVASIDSVLETVFKTDSADFVLDATISAMAARPRCHDILKGSVEGGGPKSPRILKELSDANFGYESFRDWLMHVSTESDHENVALAANNILKTWPLPRIQQPTSTA